MNYVVDTDHSPPIIQQWPSDTPPTSFDGYFVPGISEPPPYDPETQALELGPLEVEYEGEDPQPVRVRQTWTVRSLTQSELDNNELNAELALIQQLIDAHIATRDILNGSPTNPQILAAVKQNNSTNIKVLRYIKREHGA